MDGTTIPAVGRTAFGFTKNSWHFEGFKAWALLACAVVAFVALIGMASVEAQANQCATSRGSGIEVKLDICGDSTLAAADIYRIGGWNEGSNLVTSFGMNIPYNGASPPTSIAGTATVGWEVNIGRNTNGAAGTSGGACYWNDGGNGQGWGAANGDSVTYTAGVWTDAGCAGLLGQAGKPFTYRWAKYAAAGAAHAAYYCNEMDVIFPYSSVGIVAGDVIQWGPIIGAPPGSPGIYNQQGTLNQAAGTFYDLTQYTGVLYTVGTTTFNLLPTVPTATGAANGSTVTLSVTRGANNGVQPGFGFYVREGTTLLNGGFPFPYAAPGTTTTGVAGGFWPSGSGPYTLDLTNVAAGTHTYTISEANCRGEGPSVNVVVTIPPPPPTCEVVATPPVFPDTVVTYTAIGGTPPYTWSGGGNPAGAGPSSSMTFQTSWSTAGARTVQLRDAFVPVTMVDCPVVAVVSLPTPTCVPAIVSLVTGVEKTFTVSGGTAPFSWSGGNAGPLSNSDSFTTSFNEAGIHEVVVIDSNGQESACTVQARYPPLVCSPGHQIVSTGELARIRATGGSGVYEWDAPGGEMGMFSTDEMDVGYQSGGLYFVSVKSGDASTSCRVEAVQPCGTIQAGFTVSSTSVSVGQQVSFTDASSGDIQSRAWNFGDGATSSEASPVHTYSVAGTYHPRLAVTEVGSGCSSLANAEIVVGHVQSTPAGPSAASPSSGGGGATAPRAYAGADQTVLEGAKVSLRGEALGEESSDGFSFQWRLIEGPPGVPVSGSSQVLDFSAPLLTRPDQVLVLVYELRVSRGATVSEPSTVRVTVGLADKAPVANAGTELAAMRGDRVVLDGSKSSDPERKALTYAWEWVSGAEVTLTGETTASPAFTAPEAGERYSDFRLTVSDGRWSASDTVRVRYDAKPIVLPAFQVVEQAPGAYLFKAGKEASSYEWDLGDGTKSSNPEVQHTYTKAGTYTVTLTTTDAAGAPTVHSEQVQAIVPETVTSERQEATTSVLPWVLGIVAGVALLVGAALFFVMRRKTATT